MSYYGSVALFRQLSKITSDDMSDAEVEDMLEVASLVVLDDLSVLRKLETMTGEINGSNTVFYTRFKPIADCNFDKSIDASDITVYGWEEDEEGNITLTVLSVSDITPELGKVTLASAPSTDYDKIVATYRFYVIGTTPSWSLVDLATVYYAIHLAYVTLKGLLPVSFKLGSLSVSYGRRGEEKPHRIFYEKYRDIIERIAGLSIGYGGSQ